MKISTIRLHNYRAFYPEFDQQNEPKPYEIDTKDKNVLIYGENGAGKTSLFRAVDDFFRSSQFSESVRFAKNHFVPTQPVGYVELTFTDGSKHEFTDAVNTTTTKQLTIQRGQKAGGFLTYVQLIKTYLADGPINQPPELFDLLIDTILKEHLLPPSQSQTVGAEWRRLNQYLNAHRGRTDVKDQLKDDGSKKLNCDVFNNGLKDLLKGYVVNDENNAEKSIEGVEVIVNRWLDKYFKHETQIEFVFNFVEQNWDTNKKAKPRILYRSLQIVPKLHGQSVVNNYHDFLNEARLSALAICIFLASLRIYPKDLNRLNVLYLDDVFIGLDMSNRLPLLDILQNEFSDYQIFLSTYDRAWFEVAKQVVTGWQTVEMYTAEQGEKGQPGYCERPVIITPSDDHYARACKYYDAKDYAASANYLRKELEQQIKNRVAEEDVRSFDGRFVPLKTLWSAMLSRYQAHGQAIDETIKTAFDRCKLTIFNPLSHDSLSLPVYRAELDKAFWVTEEVKKLPIVKQLCLLQKGMVLTYTNAAYWIKIELQSDWYMIRHNDVYSCETPAGKVLKWLENGVENGPMTNKQPLEKIFSKVANSLGLSSQNVYMNIEVEGYNLNNLFTEAIMTFSRPMLNFLMR